MTGLAEDIADRIVALGFAVLTPAPTIFTGEMPAAPDDVIAVKELPGGPSSRAMGTVIADHPDVQVIVRRKLYASMVTAVRGVRGNGKPSGSGSGLDGWSGTIDGTEYLYLAMVGNPIYLGRDENNRRETSMTFRVTKRR